MGNIKESGRKDVAAISSQECAELYDLKILDSSIQDSNDNYTRFILIAKEIKTYDNKVTENSNQIKKLKKNQKRIIIGSSIGGILLFILGLIL